MRYLLSLLLTLFLSATASAADYRSSCRIVFQADSTLHSFDGKGVCQPFTATRSDGVLHFPKVSVAVASLDTDNKRRDKKMREMFEERKFPDITVSTGSVALSEIRDSIKKGNGSAQVHLKLKIRDMEKPVTAKVSNVVETDGRITADLAFTVSLAEYRLHPPSPLGRLIKVDDKISVKVTTILDAR